MIIQSKNITSETNQSTVKFEINNEDGHLYSVLSELYSDPTGSTIREICTNCNDAHIMSHNEERPFIIKLPNPSKNIDEITIRDFGPGLTHEQIMDIYRVYGKSTKNDSNKQTGCLGLGSKSPYSLSTTFYVKSYLNGTINLYTCSMDNNGIPNITDKPTTMLTEEENGLEIIIPIYQHVDYVSVLKKALKYFKVKPLVFKQMGNLENDQIIDIEWTKLDDFTKITDTISCSKNLLKTETYMDPDMNPYGISEVVQLQIYYPIDKTMLLNTIDRFNRAYIGLDGNMNSKFKISDSRKKIIGYILDYGIRLESMPGRIAFSPSRENIKYTDLTLDYIIKELNKAAKIIERVMIIPLKEVNKSDKTYYGTMIQNYYNYKKYSKFAKALNIDKILKRKDQYHDIFYGDVEFDNIIGKITNIKDRVNEKRLDNIFSNQNTYNDREDYRRELLNSIDSNANVMVDLFQDDIQKKLPMLKRANNNFITGVMTDRFKDAIGSIFDHLENSIFGLFRKSIFDLINNSYAEYNSSSITYSEFDKLMTFNEDLFYFPGFNFNEDESRDSKIKNYTETCLSVFEDLDDTKIVDNLFLLKNDLFYKIKEFDKNNAGDLLADTYKFNYCYVKFLIEVKLFKITFSSQKDQNQKFKNLYYMGRYLNSAIKKKNKFVRNVDYNLDSIIKHFDIYNVNVSRGRFTYFPDCEWLLTGDIGWSESVRVQLSDVINKDCSEFSKTTGLMKLYGFSSTTVFISYICEYLINNFMDVVEEQLSLKNYDITGLLKNDLTKFNIPFDLKIDSIKNVGNLQTSVVKKNSPKIKVMKHDEIDDIGEVDTKIYSSNTVFIGYSKEQLENQYTYLKGLFTIYLKFDTVGKYLNQLFQIDPLIEISESEDDSPMRYKTIRNSMFNQTDNISFMCPETIGDKEFDYINSNFSIKNYNLLFEIIQNCFGKYKESNIITTGNRDNLPEEMITFFKSVIEHSSSSSLPFGNRIIYKIPEDYNFVPQLIKLNDVTDIDSITLNGLVDYIKINHKILFFQPKSRYNIRSKSYKDIESYSDDFSFGESKIKFTEYHNKTNLGLFFKNVMKILNESSFNAMVDLWNSRKSENYLVLSNHGVLSNLLKKDSYNMYQFIMDFSRDNFKLLETTTIPLTILYSDMGSSCTIRNNHEFKYLYSSNQFFNNDRSSAKTLDAWIKSLFPKKKIWLNRIVPSDLEIYLIFNLLLKSSFDDYLKFIGKSFPEFLIGPKLKKELSISYKNLIGQTRKDIKLFFGKGLYNTITNFNVKKFFSNINEDSEPTDCANELRKVFNGVRYLDEYKDTSKFSIIYRNMLSLHANGSRKIDDYFNTKDLTNIRFFSEQLVYDFNYSHSGINKKTYNIITNYEKFGKFVNVDNVDNNDFKKIRELLRGGTKDELNKYLSMKKLHKKINIKTIIENKKNKQKRPHEKRIKYHCL